MARCHLTIDEAGHVRLVDHRGQVVRTVDLSAADLPADTIDDLTAYHRRDRIAAYIIAGCFIAAMVCIVALWLL